MLKIESLAPAFTEAFADVNAANLRKVQKLIAMMHDKKVMKLLNDAKVAENDLTENLYESVKIIEFCNAVTKEFDDFELNTLVAVKTLLNAKRLNVDVTKRDLECAILIQEKNTVIADHVVQRPAKISAPVQVGQVFNVLKKLNLVTEKQKHKILSPKESKFFEYIETRLSQVTVG